MADNSYQHQERPAYAGPATGLDAKVPIPRPAEMRFFWRNNQRQDGWRGTEPLAFVVLRRASKIERPALRYAKACAIQHRHFIGRRSDDMFKKAEFH